MADIANPINPEGDVLDYEAEEPDEDHHELKQQIDEPIVANAEPIEDDENVDVDEAKPDADEDDDEDEGAVESLEEGEVSDEDEESRKERLKPQPVCRFYSKGQCTWGSSCRFVHPGVLDKGNYNMFAPPRPILPAEQEPIEKVIEEQEKLKSPEEPVPTVRRPETAWERGLRQAREMKKLSQQRKETDIEYDEKRTNLTLTQAELDRENDYYMRPASPIRDNSEEEDFASEDVPRLRRIAPPPPPEFQSRPASRRYPSPPNRRFDRSPSPPSSRVRRVAPPRSPPGPGGPRHRRGDEWADPWMRDNAEQGRRSRPRKRSYSSGSSRSSSRSSSNSRSRSPKRQRRRQRRSSSGSSKSSRSRHRSRSRSSTPEGIPRRNNHREDDSPTVNRNTAPLQKRLMSLASTSNPASKLNIKKEPEDKKVNLSAADAALAKSNRSRKSSKSSSASSRSSSRSSSPSNRRRKSSSDHPKEVNTEITPSTPPPALADNVQDVQAAPKPSQIKMAFKPSAVSKTAANKNVLEKLGNDTSEILENAKAKREENKLKKAGEIKKEKKDKKKSTADRREELLKQLKAVENAIAKKRTKIGEKE